LGAALLAGARSRKACSTSISGRRIIRRNLPNIFAGGYDLLAEDCTYANGDPQDSHIIARRTCSALPSVRAEHIHDICNNTIGKADLRRSPAGRGIQRRASAVPPATAIPRSDTAVPTSTEARGRASI